MAKLGKIPRLDFVPNPADYRAPGNGNGNSNDKQRKPPPRKPPHAIALSPRLELGLTVQWEAAQMAESEPEEADSILGTTYENHLGRARASSRAAKRAS